VKKNHDQAALKTSWYAEPGERPRASAMYVGDQTRKPNNHDQPVEHCPWLEHRMTAGRRIVHLVRLS
jgi:hypothetical protein